MLVAQLLTRIGEGFCDDFCEARIRAGDGSA